MARFELETNIRLGRTSSEMEMSKVRFSIVAPIQAASVTGLPISLRSDKGPYAVISGDVPGAILRDLMTALDHGGWIE